MVKLKSIYTYKRNVFKWQKTNCFFLQTALTVLQFLLNLNNEQTCDETNPPSWLYLIELISNEIGN